MKMNNIKSLLLLGVAVLSAACSSDFLETEPTNRVSGDRQNELLLEDPARISSIIGGCYQTLYYGGTMRFNGLYDNGLTSYKILGDILGDDMMHLLGSGPYANDENLIFHRANYVRPTAMWSQFYNIISTINPVIAVLKSAEDATEEIESMLGQAYALRAYSYYWLINFFQHPYSVDPDAPGVLIYLDDPTQNVLGRAPVKDVYAVIDADFAEACRLLKGKTVPNTAIGEHMAAGMYANALMFLGRYADAASYAELATKGFRLGGAEDLLSGFNSLSMCEAMFGFEVTEEWNMIYASFMSMMNPYVDGYAVPGYYPIVASSDLVENINPNDIRKHWFGYKESLNVYGFPFTIVEKLGCMDYVPNKFLCPGNFMADVIYTHVAEFYFVAAEAYYLNNDATNARRMLNAVMSTRVSGYDCSNLSGQALYDEICFQKRVEMWGEGVRIFDAKRRDETFDRSKSKYYPAVLKGYNAVTYKARDQRNTYQIPTREMDNNENLTPEDQNP